LTIVAAILIAAGGIVSLAIRHKKSPDKHLEITNLNRQYEEMESTLVNAALSPVGLKQKMKADKKKAKKEAKAEKKAGKAAKSEDEVKPRKNLFVLDFHGDIRAHSVDNMREEISALLTVATENDEVLVRLESGGGTVHGYGLNRTWIRARRFPAAANPGPGNPINRFSRQDRRQRRLHDGLRGEQPHRRPIRHYWINRRARPASQPQSPAQKTRCGLRNAVCRGI
jgi:hypothetical protein